jgi:hypothetical protein
MRQLVRSYRVGSANSQSGPNFMISLLRAFRLPQPRDLWTHVAAILTEADRDAHALCALSADRIPHQFIAHANQLGKAGDKRA